MSIVQKNIPLTGNDAIRQGSTYSRTFAIKNADGTDKDLSAFIGSSKGVRCQFRASVADTAIIATPTMSFVGTTKIRMLLTSTVTTALTQPNGAYDIELFDNTVSPPLVENIQGGEWELLLEVTR